MAAPAPIAKAGLVIGLGLVVVAAIIAVDTARMQVPPSYARVGPHIFPFIIAAGLAAIGGYLAWSSSAAGFRREVVAEDQPTDWLSPLLIAAALIVHLLLLKWLGFIIVSTGLFVMVAFAFGSRSYIRDAAVGLTLAVVTYLGFTHLLGLQLPPGILAGMV